MFSQAGHAMVRTHTPSLPPSPVHAALPRTLVPLLPSPLVPHLPPASSSRLPPLLALISSPPASKSSSSSSSSSARTHTPCDKRHESGLPVRIGAAPTKHVPTTVESTVQLGTRRVRSHELGMAVCTGQEESKKGPQKGPAKGLLVRKLYRRKAGTQPWLVHECTP